jgi:ribonuclease-3
VSREACANVARRLRVIERLQEAAPPGIGKNADVLIESDRILASVCEAIIGAAYIAFGFERVAPAIVDAFEPEIDEALESPVDFKSLLQERLARKSEVVTYRIESEEGPPHERSFVAVAEVRGEKIGHGSGRTKKSAEQEAASLALDAMDDDEGGEA